MSKINLNNHRRNRCWNISLKHIFQYQYSYRSPILYREKWVHALQLDGPIPQKFWVCSEHFCAQDISFAGSDTNRKVLKKGAIPFICKITSAPKHFERAEKNTGLEATPEKITRKRPSTSSCSFHPKKRVKFFGDIKESEMIDSESIKRNWDIARNTILQQRKKINMLQQQKRRLKAKIFNLTSLVKHLKEQHKLSDNAVTSLNHSLPEGTEHIIRRFLKAPSRQKYCPELRSFALTLSFYSMKAYNYVRAKFNKTLPHPRTISKWYQSVDAAPGFLKESFNILKNKAQELQKKNQKLICGLQMDEISIKRFVEWNGKKMTGYVDLGTNLDGDDLPEAKEALVFLLVGVNAHWKLPVAYFFLNGISANEKANVIVQLLEYLYDTGAIIKSLTFDGTATNFKAASDLGADFSDPKHLKTNFKHPITKEDVHIFLDPCHMLKLIRNCLASQGSLSNADDDKIEWKYFENLVNFQNQEGLKAGTKIKDRHINWEREKMKVKIAAQTFSNSVADALIYLNRDLKEPQFVEVEATSEFCKIMNNLFDIFNCRNSFSKYIYRKPLSNENKDFIFDFLEKSRQYILGLKLNNKDICNTNRKTGFLGFLICIESLKNYYCQIIEQEKLLKYILTYKFSQDHIETFFSSIRSRFGMNNNPSARQFEHCMKRLLVRHEVKGSEYGNAVELDNTHILYCNSSSTKIIQENTSDNELPEDDVIIAENFHLSPFVEDVVAYISGFVAKSLIKKITCQQCANIIVKEECSSILQKQKSWGKLTSASDFVISICKIGEKVLRELKARSFLVKQQKNLKDYMTILALRKISPSVYDVFGDHLFDGTLIESHHIGLTKIILNKFFNVRMYHEVNIINEKNNLNRVRSILTKTILFKNQ